MGIMKSLVRQINEHVPTKIPGMQYHIFHKGSGVYPVGNLYKELQTDV